MTKFLKGDATAAITLALADGFDYSGKTVHLEYQGARRSFSGVAAGGSLTFSFTAAETAPMSLGAYPVRVWMEDENGGITTIKNADVKLCVTDSAADVHSDGAIYLDVRGGLYGIEGLPERYTDEDLRRKIHEILRRLGGTVAAFALAILPAFGATVDVQTAPKRTIYNDEQVVTNVVVDVSDLVTTGQLATAVGAIPAPDFTVSNDTLVATIEATAPTPGDYETVSNAAMNARSKTDLAVYHKVGTGDIWTLVDNSGDIYEMRGAYDDDGFWEFSTEPMGMVAGTFGGNSSNDYEVEWGGVNDFAGKHGTATRPWVLISMPSNYIVTATDIIQTGYVSTNADGVVTLAGAGADISVNGTNILPLVFGAATTNDTTLTPVRCYEPWTFSPPLDPSYRFSWNGSGWVIELNRDGEWVEQSIQKGDENSTSLSWVGDEAAIPFTATRGVTIVGYTLGPKTNIVLAPTNGILRTESDPTVSAWAKAESKPTYNAGEVGAYPNTSGEQLSAQVSAIGSYLNAEDARFVSTNYDSVVRTPEAYVEVRLTDNGTNVWTTIWREMTRWGKFVGNAFDWNTWDGFHAWATNITAQLSTKAERCWGIYDSETGGYSPEGYTQISSSNILIAAGMAYQRTVTTGGNVWVLQCNQGTAHIGGDTNGFFRVVDGDGVTQFEIIKGDRREMGADASGITVSAGNVMTIPYSVEAAEHPTIRCCNNLATADWKDETDVDCLCTVSWSGSSGAWVATVTPKTAQPSMFVKATFMAGGETYIRNVAPVGMDSIMLNGTKYYLGTATISGHTVLTLSTSPIVQ